MAHERLDSLQVIPFVQEGCGEGVPHDVGMDSLFDRGLFVVDLMRESMALEVKPLSWWGPPDVLWLSISQSFLGKGTTGWALEIFFKIKGFSPVSESNCTFYRPGFVF